MNEQRGNTATHTQIHAIYHEVNSILKLSDCKAGEQWENSFV